MDKYDVVGLLGEGSFGRVYKAKQTADSKYVALKVISKRGRSAKELKGLRRECEIQRYLHHPNIIQMLDSFETENEIVVITEFADKELNVILGKEGYLSEDRVQTIVWDLVSALYYLHSHRVLHRDLKPQNILLDSKDCAKLCDFGFARNMSTGTHVLTSIKGTPLYMAPELIEEQPYDHNADLWSLGCIIYELLVGTPPFSTVSILHLIRLIRHENIQWPTFISANCISFLKGLLQKNPTKRMTWPEILNHPFVKGHILISEDSPSMPLTRPLSVNTLQAKEQQKKDHISQKTQMKPRNNDLEVAEGGKTQYDNKTSATTSATQSNETKKSDLQDRKNNNQTVCDKFKNLSLESTNKELKKSGDIKKTSESKDDSKKSASSNKTKTKATEESKETNQDFDTDLEKSQTLQTINIYEDSHPIESEEWIVFLLRSIEEVMSGEMASLCQQNLTNIIVSPLRNSNASPKVLSYAASLLSLPFTLKGISESTVEQIKKVYVEVKLVPNLVYASKLMMREKFNESGCNSSTSQSPTNTPISYESNRPTSDLKDEELQALEYIYLLICHLVHLDIQFLNQLCDSIVIINVYNLLHRLLLLSKKKLRIVIDLVAILTQILRKTPENNEIVDRIISNNKNVNENEENVNFVDLLRHSNHLLRERTCYLILFLSKYTPQALEEIWNDKVKDTLEALVYDSMENVRNAAEKVVEELKHLHNFKTSIHSDIVQCNNSK